MKDLEETQREQDDMSTLLSVHASTFAAETFLYAHEVGYLEADESYCNYPTVSPDSFLILYVFRNTGILQYENKEYPLAAGDLVFVDCQKQYKYYTTDERGWRILYLYFGGTHAKGYYDLISNNALSIFHFKDSKITYSILWQIIDLHKRKDIYAEPLTSLHITKILTDLIMSADNQKKLILQYPEYINKLFNYIHLYYYEKISLDTLAKRWSLNKFHLDRVFKKCSGFSINEYLILTRISKAKDLLRHTDNPITQISEEVGFNSPSYFGYAFRKREKISPSDYRKQWTC